MDEAKMQQEVSHNTSPVGVEVDLTGNPELQDFFSKVTSKCTVSRYIHA
jgi:hypothetical protein